MLDDKATLLVGYEREVSPSRRRPEDGIRERDLQRIEVLSKVLDGRTTIPASWHWHTPSGPGAAACGKKGRNGQRVRSGPD